MDYRTFGTYKYIKQLRAEGKITGYRIERTGNTHMLGKWHLIFTGPDVDIWQKSKRGDAAFMTLDRVYTALRLLGFKTLQVDVEENVLPNLSHLNKDFGEPVPSTKRHYRHHRSKNNI